MAARPRKRGDGIPNLYLRRRKADISYRYRDIRTGRFHELGTDRAAAESRAKSLNAIIYQQVADQRAESIAAGVDTTNLSFAAWVDQYLNIQQERVLAEEIAPSTLKDRQQKCRTLVSDMGSLPLTMVTTRRIAGLLDRYRQQGKARMASAMRSLLIDIFREAVAQGRFPGDKPNPVMVTKPPRVRVTRSRLTLDHWHAISDQLRQYRHPWAYNAAILALVTGQRLGDVRKMRFADVVKVGGRDYLEVAQAKTGSRLRLGLDLRLEAIGVSIREAVAQCRDNVVSPYMVHHRKRIARATPSQMVRLKSITQAFASCRDQAGIAWDGTPASFHELRSLSERLYSQQGIDTQALLGHKSRRMTDTYRDARGQDWVTVGA